MPIEDVRAARDLPALVKSHRTTGRVSDPIERVSTRSGERRHCRSCGFPLGENESVVRFRYTWPARESSWWEEESMLVIHAEGCRHGSAHDQVVSGARHDLGGAGLDEIDKAVLALRVSGLSDQRIAVRLGTTPGSVETVLRRMTKGLRLSSDQHARRALETLEGAGRTFESVEDSLETMVDELLR